MQSMDLNPANVDIPEGSTPIREVRLVQYVNEDGGGLALGVEGDGPFDLINTLGMLTMGIGLLQQGQGD